eukprot:533966-Prorocentrum_minimum.AAC.1
MRSRSAWLHLCHAETGLHSAWVTLALRSAPLGASQVEDLKPPGLANALWAFATLGHVPPPALTARLLDALAHQVTLYFRSLYY